MILTLHIDKEDVYKEVERLAGYTARNETMLKDAEDNVFRRMAVTKAQRELLDERFESGCAAITEQLLTVGACTSEISEGDAYEAEVEMPYNWNNACEADVVNAAKWYLTGYVMALWMRICGRKDDEEKYGNDADEKMLMFGALLHRKRRVSREEFKEYINNRRRRCEHEIPGI